MFNHLVAAVLLVLPLAVRSECPPAEYLSPVKCRCNQNRVSCHGVQDERMLRMVMEAVRGYEIEEFLLRNSTLDFLPADLFTYVNTNEFVLVNCALKSLTVPTAGNRLFADSGIKSFSMNSVELTDEDLSHIADLDELHSLFIREYHHTLFLGTLLRHLRGKPLALLALEDIGELVDVEDIDLSNFNDLTTISLRAVGLEHLTRQQLPRGGRKLEHLWLGKNSLTELPGDFLTGFSSLQTLDIHGNMLDTLDQWTLFDFHGAISIHDNPWECDERLTWLRKRLQEKTLRLMDNHEVLCEDGTPFLPQ